MAVVWIPPLLRDLTAGRETVEAAGSSVLQIVEDLDRLYPGIKARLCHGVNLRPGLAAVVDGVASPLGLFQAVKPESEVHFLPAIAGG